MPVINNKSEDGIELVLSYLVAARIFYLVAARFFPQRRYASYLLPMMCVAFTVQFFIVYLMHSSVLFTILIPQ